MEGLQDDTGDGSMQCTEHPFKNNTPAGGICAICLQEKLGKLVSSSFPIAVFPSSSSSSPSFRSDINNITTTTAANNNTSNNNTTTVVNTAVPPRLLNSNTQITQITQITQTNTTTTTTNCQHYQYHSNRSRILYLIGQKKKKKKDQNILITGQTSHDRNTIVYKRSKSTADGLRYMNADTTSPHNKRGFWSFIHSQKPSHSTSTSSSKAKTLTSISSNTMSASTRSQRDNENEITIVENNESPCHHASFDRKVSRSRSVGCGSRSFSGDFFERISTGFGDCTLRRVESHRERKSQVSVVRNNGQDCIKERVRCGGLFSGFMITSSSSSSSSSSHWVVSNSNTKETNNDNGGTGKVTSAVAGKERSWGWALASPIRAFSKPTTSKRENSNKNVTPNLGAIPSLLSVRS